MRSPGITPSLGGARRLSELQSWYVFHYHMVEWHSDDDSVFYDLYAFSLPNSLLANLGYPLARRLQHR